MPALLILLLGTLQTGDLESSVAAYWDLLAQRDKAKALEYVTPESQNFFIQRREPVIRDWKLIAIDYGEQGQALVSVEIQREVPGMPGTLPLRVNDRWIYDGASWKVSIVAPSSEILASRLVGSAETRQFPPPGKISVSPELVKIHFLDRNQSGLVRLGNGLDVPLEVVEIDFDRDRFELVIQPENIPAGEFGAIQIRYIGSETSKELNSRLTLVVRAKGRTELTVPILFNHLSPGARALFGLNSKEAEKLRREDKLTPVLNRPPTKATPKPPH